MPIYEYRCSACDRTFEVKGSFNDPPSTPCPACGGEAHRVLHPVGIVFKGSGFYATDNRRPRYRRGDEAESKEPVEASAASDGEDGDESGGTEADED